MAVATRKTVFWRLLYDVVYWQDISQVYCLSPATTAEPVAVLKSDDPLLKPTLIHLWSDGLILMGAYYSLGLGSLTLRMLKVDYVEGQGECSPLRPVDLISADSTDFVLLNRFGLDPYALSVDIFLFVIGGNRNALDIASTGHDSRMIVITNGIRNTHIQNFTVEYRPLSFEVPHGATVVMSTFGSAAALVGGRLWSTSDPSRGVHIFNRQGHAASLNMLHARDEPVIVRHPLQLTLFLICGGTDRDNGICEWICLDVEECPTLSGSLALNLLVGGAADERFSLLTAFETIATSSFIAVVQKHGDGEAEDEVEARLLTFERKSDVVATSSTQAHLQTADENSSDSIVLPIVISSAVVIALCGTLVTLLFCLLLRRKKRQMKQGEKATTAATGRGRRRTMRRANSSLRSRSSTITKPGFASPSRISSLGSPTASSPTTLSSTPLYHNPPPPEKVNHQSYHRPPPPDK